MKQYHVFLWVISMFLIVSIVIAEEQGAAPAPDEFGFTTDDYTTSKVNELTPEQLYSALSAGKISDYSLITDVKLKEVIVDHTDLWEKRDLVHNLQRRIEDDVSFVNNDDRFKSAWFNQYKVTCSDCMIGKYSANLNIIFTVNAHEARQGNVPWALPIVVSLPLSDFPQVEILENGQVYFPGGSVVGNAIVNLNKQENTIELKQPPNLLVAITVGEKSEGYSFTINGRGKIILADDASFIGDNIIVRTDDQGLLTIISPSSKPTELHYAHKADKSLIPYAFKGEISFHKQDLDILQKRINPEEKNALSDVTFRHISLGKKTTLYDFTIGNVLTVEKPTDYYHKTTAELLCIIGSNCVEYHLDKEKMGGVMHIEAADDNVLRVNVVNLETRKGVRYTTFEEKLQKEIDQEFASLSIGPIVDNSKVIINDNSRVMFEFSADTPVVKGKIMDKTISTIEVDLPSGGILDRNSVTNVDEQITILQAQKMILDQNGEISVCSNTYECVGYGTVSSEVLALTPREISERVYIAAHRYALCYEETGKCTSFPRDYPGASGFNAGPNVLEELFGTKRTRKTVQWATTCIGLTKASLPLGEQEEVEPIDRGIYVQDYLRRNVPGFKSMYILVQEYKGYSHPGSLQEEVNEERVRQLVEQRVRAGENIEIVVVPTTRDRTEILQGMSRGSLVTEPVDGHDYVYAGIDSVEGRPTTYEAHIGDGRITRDVNGIAAEAILITYDTENSNIDYLSLFQKGTVYRYIPETKKMEAIGVPELKDRTKVKEALAKGQGLRTEIAQIFNE